MLFVGKLMELEIITLIKIRKIERKYHIFSHMHNHNFKKDMKLKEGIFEKWNGTRMKSGQESILRYVQDMTKVHYIHE
jgi:hypothetical protein